MLKKYVGIWDDYDRDYCFVGRFRGREVYIFLVFKLLESFGEGGRYSRIFGY